MRPPLVRFAPRAAHAQRATLVAAIACIAPLTACGAVGDAVGGGDPNSDLDVRQSVYVEHCMNQGVYWIDHFLSTYFAAAPSEGGPTDGSLFVGLSQPTRSELCDEAIAAIGDSTDPSDVAARELGASFDVMYPVTDEIVRYYQRSDFLDDALARGKELHAELTTAVDGYTIARDAFAAQVGAITDAQNAGVLDAAADEAADLTTLLGASMTRAEEALVVLEDETGSIRPSADYGSVDAAAFAAAVDLLVATWDRTTERAATTDEDDAFVTYSLFARGMEETVAAFLDVKRRLASDTPFTQEELDEIANAPTTLALSFGFEHLVDSYNSLVDRYNGLG